MSFRIVVPARYASSRLPGKPLADIAGKPMVVRVVEAVAHCGAEEVLVATDDARVANAVQAYGIEVAMTSADHASGTDRIAEVAARRQWADEAVVVNVQGDEPLLDSALVVAVARALEADALAAIATAAHPLADAGEFLNPNVVKVVVDAAGRAMYFSRAPIPWPRDAQAAGAGALPVGLAPLRHVGLYAYRCGFLRRFGTLAPAPPEQWEALEQLRALWHGFPIRVVVSESAPMPGVDTEADLERVRQFFASIAR